VNGTVNDPVNRPTTGFFVTGTDTGVGKTVLSALLVAALDAVYWKPVQTGVIEGTDRKSVALWAEIPEERLLPERFRFDPPVSPHLAAREAGVRIALDAFEFPEAPAGRPWIIEGAGGVMVPLNERDLMLDLMRHVGLPVVIASRTALGTINHTLLTLAALRKANLKICGVVMIGKENLENRRAIEHYGNILVIGHIPMLEQINRTALLDVFARYFDRAAF
jgi:dethiobiotin synthetase